MLRPRFLFAARLASLHLLASLLVMVATGLLVFVLWYPAPYYKIAGGIELFLLIVGVDLVCGPLLTFVLGSPSKPHGELVRDIGLIVLIQLGALGYGVHSLYQARPVYLAWEGDRFRLVTAADIEPVRLLVASEAYRQLPVGGPQLVATRLLGATDPGYLISIEDALKGLPPSYKPERWESYSKHMGQILAGARALQDLPEASRNSPQLVGREAADPRTVYYPLEGSHDGNWIVLLTPDSAELVDFLPLKGWR